MQEEMGWNEKGDEESMPNASGFDDWALQDSNLQAQSA